MALRDERSRARAQEAAAELPEERRLDLRRLFPSVSSLLAGFVLLALGLGGYAIARGTSFFEIRRIEVVGGTPVARARVESALSELEGRSLVGLERADLDRRIATLPDVVGVTHDRAFPHTLRVYVLAERPLLVLRRGSESWLVSVRARVVRPLERGALPRLPRIWVPRTVDVRPGDTLADPPVRRAVRVLAPAREELPGKVRVVRFAAEGTTLLLRSGLELRLGREQDIRLKLAVAAHVLPRLAADATYLDVAVPERPVADGAG